MRAYRLTRQQWIPKSIDDAWTFFSRPENLETISPPYLRFQIVSADPELRRGSLIEYRLRIRGLPMRWVSEITEWEPPHRFVDTQLKGPYALWRHQHVFVAEGDGTRITDDVEYALPFGPLGQLVHGLIVREDVEGIFEFRRRKLEELMGA